MFPEQRHRQILNLIELKKQVKVNELAEALDVSKETIRRDLTILEDKGGLRKVHGAALHIQTAVEPIFSKRQTSQREEKQKIALYAAEIFHNGDSVMIEGGTTTDVLASELAKKNSLTIITNSFAAANIIYQGAGMNDIFILGGKYKGENLYTHGPIVAQQVKSFMADYAVLTIGAINQEKGIMYHDHEEIAIGVAMMEQARMSIVLADHTKFGKNALVPLCPLQDIDILVTDQTPELEMLEALQSANVQLITAQ